MTNDIINLQFAEMRETIDKQEGYSKSIIEKQAKVFDSFDQFKQPFLKYTRDLPINSQAQENIKYLYRFYSEVSSRGGLVQVNSRCLLPIILENLQKYFKAAKELSLENLFYQYKKYLLGFQVLAKSNQTVQSQKLKSIEIIRFIPKEKIKSSLLNKEKEYQEIFSGGVVILKDFTTVMKLNQDRLALDSLFQYYKFSPVKIKIQKKIEFGEYRIEGVQKTEKFKLKNFMFYVSNRSNYQRIQKSQFSDILKTDTVLSVTDFVPPDERCLNEIYKIFVDSFLCYKGKYDFLSYLDEDVLGITIPKFSILVEGCWQGAKRQHLNLSSIYINNGPDSIEWFAIQENNFQNFSQILKQKFKVNILEQEEIWFQRMDWFIINNIPIKKLIQEKGDVVVVSPGTIFWRRSLGVNLVVSWNIMPKIKKQITSFTKRYQDTKELKEEKAPKMPMKSLFMRIINHQINLDSTVAAQIVNNLKKVISEEEKLLDQLIIKVRLGKQKIRHFPLYDNEAKCTHCQQYIFNYFTQCEGVCCLLCFKNNKVIKKNFSELFFRYEPFYINQLIDFSLNKNRTQFPSLCNKENIGQIEHCGVKLPEDYSFNTIQQEQFNQIYEEFLKKNGIKRLLNEIQKEKVPKNKNIECQTPQFECSQCIRNSLKRKNRIDQKKADESSSETEENRHVKKQQKRKDSFSRQTSYDEKRKYNDERSWEKSDKEYRERPRQRKYSRDESEEKKYNQNYGNYHQKYDKQRNNKRQDDRWSRENEYDRKGEENYRSSSRYDQQFSGYENSRKRNSYKDNQKNKNPVSFSFPQKQKEKSYHQERNHYKEKRENYHNHDY